MLKSSSAPLPVNKGPSVYSVCLLLGFGVEILALTPKGYCQFIRGLFILWGLAGREVRVTRRRWGSSLPRCSP